MSMDATTQQPHAADCRRSRTADRRPRWPRALRAVAVGLTVPTLMALPSSAAEPTRSLAGAYLAAEHARAEGDLTLASTYLDRAIGFNRTDAVLAHRAFLMALSTGRIDRAVDLAERVRQVDPNGQLSLMVVAVDAVRDGDPAAALDYVDSMEESGIGQYVVPLMRAWISAIDGDRAAAETALSAFDDTPELGPLADYHRGLIAAVFGDIEAAAEILAPVVESGASLRETRTVGWILEAAGNIDGARTLYTDILDRAPDLPTAIDALARLEAGESGPAPVPDAVAGLAEALFHLSSLFGGREADEIALFYARLAEALQPDAGHIRYQIGSLLTDMDLSGEAISVLEGIAPDTADGWSARYLATRLHAQREALDTAQALAEELIALRPGIGGGGILLGDVLRYRGDYEGAVEAYRRAAEMSDTPLEDRWLYVFKLAMALERVDRFEEAEPLFRQAIALEPNNATLLNYLGYSLIDRGEKLEEAEAMIREAVALQPQSGHIVDSLGWAHFRLGRYDEAVLELERAVSLEPADPVILDHLGDAYWVVGREREARYRWRDALREAGDDTDLILAIERKLTEGLDMNSLPTVPGLDEATASHAPDGGSRP